MNDNEIFKKWKMFNAIVWEWFAEVKVCEILQ